MSDPQPRRGLLGRFRRQDNEQQATTARDAHAASLASSFGELARADMSIGRVAADRRDVNTTTGRVTPDQIASAASERAAALDDTMHNLTVGSASSAYAVRVAADAYGEWQHTAPDVTDRAERLYAAAHDDVGATPVSSLPEIGAAVDTVRFDSWARSAVRSGLMSKESTQDDLSSGIVDPADLDGYVDAVRETVNFAMDRLEHEPGSAGTAVELAASAYAEHGAATNAETLYNAAHETAGITPATPLSTLVAEVTAANEAADAAAAAEYSKLWQEQQAPTVDLDNPRTNTGELISLEVDQHIRQLTQNWVDLVRQPGRDVDANNAYAALVAEVDNLDLNDTYLDPRAALPKPAELIEQLGTIDLPNTTTDTPAASETGGAIAVTPQAQRGPVSSYPMDVASSLRSAAATPTAPATPSTAPTRPASSTQRAGGAER
ncbi:hypothetical protein ABH929_003598 [Curtobacterium sp. AB7]